MTYEKVVQRPDPRRPESWCHEGVTHDHQACGLGAMWDSSDPRDVEEAARWADDQGRAREAAVPTCAEVMSLVRRYALARITQNASTPTKRQRENATCVELHERDCREVERLAREIADALARAGLK